MIELRGVTYIWGEGTPFEMRALDNVNIKIEDGEFVGLIGHTGSGKSTLVQHLNGLLSPTEGSVLIDGEEITADGKSLKLLRKKVGLVFQYPEYQLFEETVEKDVAFGPVNLGFSEEEVQKSVRYAIERVGLDYETVKDRSPFELSGGQKRRVAIAGVIAMRPKILVLDEPTAGLDPMGKREILDEIKSLFLEEGISIILVSHSMEDIARLATKIIVMDHGKLLHYDAPREIFKKADELEAIGLDVPEITRFMRRYKAEGHSVRDDVITVEEAFEEIMKEKGMINA